MLIQIYAIAVLIMILGCVSVISLAVYLDQRKRSEYWSTTLYQAGLFTAIGIFLFTSVFAALVLSGVIQ